MAWYGSDDFPFPSSDFFLSLFDRLVVLRVPRTRAMADVEAVLVVTVVLLVVVVVVVVVEVLMVVVVVVVVVFAVACDDDMNSGFWSLLSQEEAVFTRLFVMSCLLSIVAYALSKFENMVIGPILAVKAPAPRAAAGRMEDPVTSWRS